MTMQQRLLTKIALLVISFSGSVQAKEYNCSNKFDVLIRTDKGFEFQSKDLKKLACNDTFEGEDFKIVHGTQDEAIRFDDDKEVVKRAANVYYHLTLAKNYWINEIKSEYVTSLKQLTIRVGITNAFSKMRHFKHEDQEENYNNAWSIPEGKTPRFVKERKEWDKEIWFSPMKVINSREQVKTKGKNPIHQNLEIVKEPLVETNKNGLIYQGLGLIKDPNIYGGSDYITSAAWNLGILAVIYTASEVTKEMDKYFVNKFYYVDTAMVPEIIYHEFAHIALSDTMKTVHSVPVIEGMADYFASRLQTSSILYKKLDGYSLNRTKNLYNKSLYHPYLEEGWNAESDFVLSLLWKARTNFDTANKKRMKKGNEQLVDFDQLVYRAHFQLNEESDIMNDLTSSLLEACKTECDSKRYGSDVLHRSYEQKGLN